MNGDPYTNESVALGVRARLKDLTARMNQEEDQMRTPKSGEANRRTLAFERR